jgi:hypothetical protein
MLAAVGSGASACRAIPGVVATSSKRYKCAREVGSPANI